MSAIFIDFEWKPQNKLNMCSSMRDITLQAENISPKFKLSQLQKQLMHFKSELSNSSSAKKDSMLLEINKIEAKIQNINKLEVCKENFDRNPHYFRSQRNVENFGLNHIETHKVKIRQIDSKKNEIISEEQNQNVDDGSERNQVVQKFSASPIFKLEKKSMDPSMNINQFKNGYQIS